MAINGAVEWAIAWFLAKAGPLLPPELQHPQAAGSVVGGERRFGRAVGRAVVDDHDLGDLLLAQRRSNRPLDRLCRILGGDDDADFDVVDGSPAPRRSVGGQLPKQHGPT